MKALLLIPAYLCCLSGICHAGTVTLAWDPNTEPDIAGYELRYGEYSGNYSTVLQAGNASEITVNDLTEGKTYFFAVFAKNAVGLLSGPSNEVVHTMDNTPVVPHGSMTVVSVSSEQADTDPATNAIDGDPLTFWHSEWKTSSPPGPHEITISLGGQHTLQGFRYLPRQDTYLNGDIRDYEFFLSTDGITWGTPIAGRFANDKLRQQVLFPVPVAASHIRLRGLTDASGIGYIAAAEIEALLAPDPDPLPPPTPPASPKGFRVLPVYKSSDNKNWALDGYYVVRPDDEGNYPPTEFYRTLATFSNP